MLTNEPQREDAFHKEWETWRGREVHKDWLRGLILSNGYDSIKILNAGGMIKFFSLSPDPMRDIHHVTQIVSDKPYTYVKAELLLAIKKIRKRQDMKDKFDLLDKCKSQILNSASDSVIITKYCA